MTSMQRRWLGAACAAVILAGAASALAQPTPPTPAPKPQDTEQWTPVPAIVTPGAT